MYPFLEVGQRFWVRHFRSICFRAFHPPRAKAVSQEVGDMVTHIATAATQQSSATEDINNSMNQTARLLIESADGAQQSEKACQELSSPAFDLRKLVGNFRLPGDGVQDVTNNSRAASTRHSGLSRPNSVDAPRSFAAAAR